jgi:cytochrome c oxidase subunit IV
LPRPLLALRGHRLGVSFAAALPDPLTRATMTSQAHPHTTSTRTYLLVWAALIVMTLLTVYLAYVDLGEWHTAVGLLIAVTKATLIVLFFMHALGADRLVWMVIAVTVLFLAIMYGFTFSDFATRGLDRGIRDPAPPAAPAPPGPQ